MREVYIVKHDVFSYDDYSYDSLVEVFYDENSARNYFEIKKEEIYREGFFDYEVIGDVAILKYTYKDNVSYGIFNFGAFFNSYISGVTGTASIIKCRL